MLHYRKRDTDESVAVRISTASFPLIWTNCRIPIRALRASGRRPQQLYVNEVGGSDEETIF